MSNATYPPELIITVDREQARMMGFVRPDRSHREWPWIKAWWPRLGGDTLRGPEWARVTIMSGARQHWGMRDDPRMRRELERGIENARLGLRLQPMMFLELP